MDKKTRQVNYNTPINGVKPWLLVREALYRVEKVDWIPIINDLMHYYSAHELSRTVGKSENYIRRLLTLSKKLDVEHEVGLKLLAIHEVFYGKK